MTNLKEISRQMAARLKREIAAEHVWLFGSQARGDANANSDIDMLAVVADSAVSRYQRAIAARRALTDFDVPVDVIVMTNGEWTKQLKAPSSLANTVLKEGIVLI